MELVKAFNAELQSLYEAKPPISKAKMTSITRSAIKAIMLYKHVVQSVEKFIQKSKPEYKVPGLYVVDSIVRQSRHQFTPEKDVFAPRFARNIRTTFIHLLNCPPEDRGKVVRVLNLWQKNQVFSPEVIQPLLDMAALASKDHASSNGVQLKTPPSTQPRTPDGKSHAKEPSWLHGSEQHNNNKFQNLPRGLMDKQNDSNALHKKDDSVKFDKKLLDFDYGDEDDDEQPPPPVNQPQPLPSLDSLQTILSNPEVLRQLQTLQQQMATRQQQSEMEDKMRRLQEMRHQEEEFDKHLAQTVPNLPFASECDFKPGIGGDSISSHMPVPPPSMQQPSLPQAYSQPNSQQHNYQHPDHAEDYDERPRAMLQSQQRTADGVEVIDLLRDSPSRDSSSRSRRKDRRSASPRNSRNRRSRSRSRSRRRRSRSNEREWDVRKPRDLDREKDRERKRRGLPPLKKNYLAVCSTTLWVGHLSKLVQEEELSDTFGEFGDVVSINLIPPRGCAFICMNRRQDALKALQHLRHYKLQGKTITIAWAPGKGMKDREWKDYWEVDLGVSYIPWNKLSNETNFKLLEEGSIIDEDSIPEWLKGFFSDDLNQRDKENNQHKHNEDMMILDDKKDSMEGLNLTPGKDLDIPMPSASIPGFIPLPEPTIANPSQAAQPPTPIPPPPMGLMPPFAIPPRLLGPMGMPLVGNVPLGVPPPLMMPQQLMPPRMPGNPFNPASMGLMPQMGGGGAGSQDKNKGGMPLPSPSSDPFGAHMGNPFGIPLPMPVPPGPPMMGQNKGPAEMDLEDTDEPKEDGRHGMNMMNLMASYGQPPPPMFPGGPPQLVPPSNHPSQEQREDLSDSSFEKGDTDMRKDPRKEHSGRIKRERSESPSRKRDPRGHRRDWGNPRNSHWDDSGVDRDEDERRMDRNRSPMREHYGHHMQDEHNPRQPLLMLPDQAFHQMNRPVPYGSRGYPPEMEDEMDPEEFMMGGGGDYDYPPHRGYFSRGMPPHHRGMGHRGGPMMRGPPLHNPHSPYTPNGPPMFGPRGPPGHIGMRGHPPPSRPGMRMEQPGFGGRSGGFEGGRGGFEGGRGRGMRGGRFLLNSPRPERPERRRDERERKSRWSNATQEDRPEIHHSSHFEGMPSGMEEHAPPDNSMPKDVRSVPPASLSTIPENKERNDVGPSDHSGPSETFNTNLFNDKKEHVSDSNNEPNDGHDFSNENGFDNQLQIETNAKKIENTRVEKEFLPTEVNQVPSNDTSQTDHMDSSENVANPSFTAPQLDFPRSEPLDQPSFMNDVQERVSVVHHSEEAHHEPKKTISPEINVNRKIDMFSEEDNAFEGEAAVKHSGDSFVEPADATVPDSAEAVLSNDD